MKVAYVVSDISYPPVEGLHQQTLLLLRGLRSSGIEVELHGFVKSIQNLDQDALYRDFGIAFSSQPRERSGSLLFSALRNLSFYSQDARELRRIIEHGEYDLIHAEGIAACSVLRGRERSKAILSFVDPGSLRNFRFFGLAGTVRSRAKYLIASVAFFALERFLRGGTPVWHVVSIGDRGYLERAHKYSNVRAIPISLPVEFDDLGDAAFSSACSSPPSRIRILIYADLRQPHMRNGLQEFVENVFQKIADKTAVDYIVLGRVECDDEMAGWFQGLNYEFIAWADDYLKVLRAADIVVLPDGIGTGLKNRAVQSMAASVPVLGTKVAFEGIEISDGVDSFSVQDSAAAIHSLSRLIGDKDLRDRMGRLGRARAISDFGSETVLKLWIETYESLRVV